MVLEPIRVLEERIDHAQIVQAISGLAESASGVNARVQLAAQIAEQLHALEMEHAKANREIQGQLLEVYEDRVDRMIHSRSLLNVLTLGFFGKVSWEDCTECARREIAALVSDIRAAQAGQITHAVIARLPLLEYTLGSREGALGFAEVLLQHLAPDEYRMLQQLAASQTNEGNTTGYSDREEGL